jgi:hypothetical protein
VRAPVRVRVRVRVAAEGARFIITLFHRVLIIFARGKEDVDANYIFYTPN